MTLEWRVVIDAADPHGWRAWLGLASVRHPDGPFEQESGTGLGRWLLFQRVPEPRTVKNRFHLGLHAGPERREAEVARLEGLGAKVPARWEPGGTWTALGGPEGNEFCVR